MALMTRDVLAERLAERAEITLTAARDEVKWFFDTLSSALATGDEVRIHGFGAFKTAQRAARTGRNPRTGETVKVPARRVVRFSASTTLTESLKSSAGARKSRAKR
jgi:DNA-binding protein HU-beta